MGSEIDNKIIRQVEYYFGDANLMRDKFLQEEIKKDDGWVPMETMLKFKRLASLSADGSVIAEALRKSESGLLEVAEDGSKIRRVKPVQEVTEDLKKEIALKTVYCKGFDKSATLDKLLEFFKEYPTVASITMRYYGGKTDPQFKGSALVQFESREQAEKFMNVETVKFEEVSLFRQWYEEWKQGKDEVYQKKEEVKKAKLEKKEQEKESLVKELSESTETGSILLITGLGQDCSWTDVKDTFNKMMDNADIRFVEIEKEDGKVQAYVRLPSAEVAKQLKEKAGDVVKIKDSEGAVSILEGDAEKEFINRAAARRIEARKGSQQGGKRSRGGRGGGRGRFAKRQRRD